MYYLYKNKVLRNYLLITFILLLIEIIFKLVMGISFLDWSILRIFLGINIFSLLISLVISYCKRWTQNIVIMLVSLIMVIIGIVQAGFYNYLGTYMSVGTASQAGAVGDFISDFIGSFKWTYWLLTIVLVVTIIYYIFGDRYLYYYVKDIENSFFAKFKGKKKKKKAMDEYKQRENVMYKKSRVIAGISFIGCCLFYYATLYIPFMQNSLQMVSNASLFKNPSMPNIAVSQFGIGGFEFIDVKALFFKTEDESAMFTKPDAQEETDFTRNIDDSLWDAAQENETNKDYKKLNSYFMSKDITVKNEYTGLFEDKNLIMVMMESGSNVMLNYPEYFPNIAKLYNDGWAWDNAFSPRNACSTGNNEMTGLTSLYTINRSCTANVYKDNTYFEAMFNLFNYKNYTTSSYHDYTDHFYYRHTIHPNMGSNKFYGVSDLGIKLGSGYQPWPSDVEFISKAVPNFIEEDKFMVWLTTVSSHMSYSNSSVTGDMNLGMYKDQSWNIAAKRYMSKLKILDDSIGELVNMLTESGKLEDSVIVLFADHYPYGLTDSAFSSIAKYETEGYGNVDRTPFIIYNPSLTPTKYDSYTSFINILPTVANLFNLDYDPRLYGGHDLLSEDYENRVVFADGSWRSEIAYFDATGGKISYTGEERYTADEIVAINTKIKNEIEMDNLAIETNYFEYLAKVLGRGLVVSSLTETTDDTLEETEMETDTETELETE